MDETNWKEQTEELATQIEHEEQMWKQQGFHGGMITIDARLMQFKVNTLVAIITEVLGVDPEQLDVVFKGRVLAQMKADRAMLTEERMKAARPDIAIARKPGILRPDGQPFSL